MELTAIGYVLLPAAILAFLLSPRVLYAMVIFSIPFSATAFVNVRADQIDSGVQVYMVIGALWILRTAITNLAQGKIVVPPPQYVPVALWTLFSIVVLFSLTMPLVIDGDLIVVSPNLVENLNNLGNRPLRFSLENVTQTSYMMFGVLLASFIAIRNRHLSAIVHSTRVYMGAAIFVSIWGWLQWTFYQLHVPYPTVFNNSSTSSAQGFTQTLGDLKRISSVAVEPSILSQFLLTAFPFFLFAVLLKTPILSRALDGLGLLLVTSVILLSTSASGFLGLGIALCFTVGALTMLGRLRSVQALLVLIAPIIVIGPYIFSSGLQGFVNTIVLEKLSSYSGRERLTSIALAWQYFAKYPILGVGWGSVTSHDLIVRILANTGIIGLGTFVLPMVWLTLKGVRTRRFVSNIKSTEAVVWAASLVSFLTLILISLLTGFPFVFGHFWFVIAMMMALPCIRYGNSRYSAFWHEREAMVSNSEETVST